MEATSRRVSTTSKVKNAPTPRLWSTTNFGHPPPILTVDTPGSTGWSRRIWRGHSFNVLIEVTRAHSSSLGQPVSAVNVAGISYHHQPTHGVRPHTLQLVNTRLSRMLFGSTRLASSRCQVEGHHKLTKQYRDRGECSVSAK